MISSQAASARESARRADGKFGSYRLGDAGTDGGLGANEVDEMGVDRSGMITEGDLRGLKENWAPGERAYFEYHCNESHFSPDAPIWYRSHQVVTVHSRDWGCERDNGVEGCTMAERMEFGAPATYRVVFEDGLTWDVMEDELSATPEVFERPDPPAAPKH